MDNYLLIIMGFLTGLIDSVVGGGGLISLPSLSIALSPGPHAVGTNKIVGVTGAAVALFVYARKGHLLWREGLVFCLICACGSFLGSTLGPMILSKEYFRYLMIIMCPVILAVVWNKDRFIHEHKDFVKPNLAAFFITALMSGFYDGFFGPGGGTFMFLALFLVNGFPLLQAIAISKLANTFSAGVALVTYAHQGYVHWKIGALTAVGMVVGAFIGATYATRSATKIIRPMLIFIVVLLMVKLIWF